MAGDQEGKTVQDNIFKDRWFWISFFVGGVVLSLTLWFGFGMDQSICAYIAWVWKTFHQPPYVGVWDLSFPGIFIIYSFPVRVFGAGIFSIRAFDFLVQLTCLIMLFYLSKKLSGSSRAGFFTNIFYSIFYYGLGQTDTAQRESYIFWLLLICMVVALSLQNRVWLRAAVVGLLAGFCFLIKPFYGLAWPIFGILFLAQGLGKKSDIRLKKSFKPSPLEGEGRERGINVILEKTIETLTDTPEITLPLIPSHQGRGKLLTTSSADPLLVKQLAGLPWLELFIFSLCCLLPSLIVVLYYFRIGHLLDLYQQTLWFNFVIYGKGREQTYGPATLLIYVLRHNFLKRPLLLLLGLAGIFLLGALKDRRKNTALFWVLLSMLAMGVIVYLLQNKFFPFHLFIFLGFLTIFAGFALAFIGEKIQALVPKPWARLASSLCYAAAILITIIFLGPESISFALNYGFRDFESGYKLGSGFANDPHQSADQYMAAKFLEPLLRPDDELEFFGPYPLLQFLLKKKLPSRYACVQHFLFLPADNQTTPEQKQWMKEYSDAIIKQRPRFFLVTDSFPGARNKFMNLKSRSLRQTLNDQFPELKNFLQQNYRLIATVRAIDVYELAR